MAYVQLDEMVAYLGAGSARDDELIQGLLDAAQANLERELKCKYEATADQTRTYSADDLREWPTANRSRYSWDQSLMYNSRNALLISDGLLSVTSLLNGDGTVLAPSQYWLRPQNTPPYGYIVLQSSGAWIFNTDGLITLTGRFGASLTAPPGIQLATKMLAAYYYREKDAQVFETITLPGGQEISVPAGFPATVAQMLRRGAYYQPIMFA